MAYFFLGAGLFAGVCGVFLWQTQPDIAKIAFSSCLVGIIFCLIWNED